MPTTNPKPFSIKSFGVVALLLGLAFTAGSVVGSRFSSNDASSAIDLTPLKLHADAAARGKSISLATGWIDDAVEGLYILDHMTGNLQCWVISPKTGAIAGMYTANVNVGLEADRAGEKDYVMTTGSYAFSGGNSGQRTPARSVVYVADGGSGNVAAYGLQYDKVAIRRGNGVDSGTLELIGQGPARGGNVTRDQ